MLSAQGIIGYSIFCFILGYLANSRDKEYAKNNFLAGLLGIAWGYGIGIGLIVVWMVIGSIFF